MLIWRRRIDVQIRSVDDFFFVFVGGPMGWCAADVACVREKIGMVYGDHVLFNVVFILWVGLFVVCEEVYS